MLGNLLVNGILFLILFGLYSFSPWASLIVALLSLFTLAFELIFDKDHIDRIASDTPDQYSLILAALISLIAVIISIISVMNS